MIEVLANAVIIIILQSLFTQHIVHFKLTQYYVNYISILKSLFREEILTYRVATFYHFKCIISNKTYKRRKQEYMIHTHRKKQSVENIPEENQIWNLLAKTLGKLFK